MAEVGALAAWAGTFRVSQGFEVWRALGAWVAEHRPAFGPGVAERFRMASQIAAAEVWASREGLSLLCSPGAGLYRQFLASLQSWREPMHLTVEVHAAQW